MVKQTIQIYARLRPTRKPSALYSLAEDNGGPVLEFVVPHDAADGFINNKRENYKFKFQQIFDQGAKQEEIFESIAKPVAEKGPRLLLLWGGRGSQCLGVHRHLPLKIIESSKVYGTERGHLIHRVCAS